MRKAGVSGLRRGKSSSSAEVHLSRGMSPEIAEVLDESEERIREIIDMCAADEEQEGK